MHAYLRWDDDALYLHVGPWRYMAAEIETYFGEKVEGETRPVSSYGWWISTDSIDDLGDGRLQGGAPRKAVAAQIIRGILGPLGAEVPKHESEESP
jgi:hypothetical protein